MTPSALPSRSLRSDADRVKGPLGLLHRALGLSEEERGGESWALTDEGRPLGAAEAEAEEAAAAIAEEEEAEEAFRTKTTIEAKWNLDTELRNTSTGTNYIS